MIRTLKQYGKLTETPQNRPIPGRADMVQNAAGGYGWQTNKWTALRRFLILGTTGGTYYATEQELTEDAIENLLACLSENPVRYLELLIDISKGGKASKNDWAIYALAVMASAEHSAVRAGALGALNEVCRTGTHLFMFAEFVNGMRGWGRGLRTAVGNWYASKEVDRLAYQVVKYQQRGGWSHADLLRLAHPKSDSPVRNHLYKYVVDGDLPVDDPLHGDNPSLALIYGAEAIKHALNAREAARLIREYRLPREAVPTQFLATREAWDALLRGGEGDHGMPMTAMIRNLGNMTKNGLLTPLSDATEHVTTQLGNTERLRASRVHPIQVLSALMTYASGQSVRGDGEWSPVRQIVDALDAAFYASFENVEPVGKPVFIGIDISGSMKMGMVGGVPNLTPAMAACALALITVATEPRVVVGGFDTQFTEYPISRRQRLDDVMRMISFHTGGGTDCALPPLYAIEKGYDNIELFEVLTDNETWAGRMHPSQALKQYRQTYNASAKLAVVGMTSTGFTIADPKDPGMLDVVGLSTDTPAIVSAFGRGEV